ncbi:hyaluronan mediated motility receptor [Orussus abietinus]|uniref:hyaluronan mediated motility receptor n=1 Tax=Orussus abietinus TaxID=222816 RepID=UPI00062657DF|nr:hyaluronan mediated motility receptor [Orussus abietinus]
MSFSKARIQRFNELGSEAPPPGAYDPKFDVKVKGAVLEKTERFQESRSVSSSSVECVTSVSSKGTTNAVPHSFRTPQLPRKKILVKPLPASCPKKSKVTTGTPKAKYEIENELADLKVECLNKDKTIAEYERHIDELREEIQKLGTELAEVQSKQAEVEEQHSRDIEAMARLQQEVLTDHDEKHSAELELLRVQLTEVMESKEREVNLQKEIQNDLRSKIEELTERTTNMEEELRKKQDEEIAKILRRLELDSHENEKTLQEEIVELRKSKEQVERELTDLRLDHENVLNDSSRKDKSLQEEMEELRKSREQVEFDWSVVRSEHEKALHSFEERLAMKDREIEELKDSSRQTIEEETKRIQGHANMLIENAEAVTRETLAACRAECEERVKRTIAESDAKISTMVREARTAVEDEMRTVAERYKSCLERVESERAMLDEKLTQKDEEVNKLSQAFEELKNSAETQESFSQSLQAELDRAETELMDKKEELKALKDHMRGEAAAMVARRKRFEIVMAENQASVAALTDRLAQSDAEVERLQREVQCGEVCIKEHRELLSALRDSSKMTYDQIRSLMDQLDVKRELMDQVDASIADFESIKSIFEAKIEGLKDIAAKELTLVREECDRKTKLNVALKAQLDEMSTKLSEAQELLLNLEEKYDSQVVEIAKLQLANERMQQEIKLLCKVAKDNEALFEEQTDRHTEEKNKLKDSLSQLKLKVEELKRTLKERDEEVKSHDVDKMRLLTVQAELAKVSKENERRENVEEEYRILSENYQRLKAEFEDVATKYSEILGHHNHKQRIKHISQLKEKICRLEQEVESRNVIIDHQQKSIDKLKEDKRLQSKGKENRLVAKSAHTTPVSSPLKPATPLRERNE